jgi:hypothetical protein
MAERIQVFVANLLWHLWLHPCRWLGHKGPYLGGGCGTARMCHRCLDMYEAREDWPDTASWRAANKSIARVPSPEGGSK